MKTNLVFHSALAALAIGLFANQTLASLATGSAPTTHQASALRVAISLNEIMVEDMILAAGTVIEVKTQDMQSVIKRPLWNGESEEGPYSFRSGIEILSSPGYSQSDFSDSDTDSSFAILEESLREAREITDANTSPGRRRYVLSNTTPLFQPEQIQLPLVSAQMDPMISDPEGALESNANEQYARLSVGSAVGSIASESSPLRITMACQNCLQKWKSAGVPTKALGNVAKFMKSNAGRVNNKKHLAIIDATQSSNKRRMYILNLQTGSVEKMHAAHGKTTDPRNTGRAQFFSNSAKNATPPGFHVTAHHAGRKYTRALLLKGLEKRNSFSARRAILIHKAPYVSPQWINRYGKPGRSNGCVAVAPTQFENLMRKLGSGALVYIHTGR